MAHNFLDCDRDQPFLLPPDLREWLPDDHLAWSLIDAVAEFDLSAFYAAYREDGWGRAAHDPQMMVSLVLYAYCADERSSRRIERRCHEDVAFRVIAANRAPDHTTISRFIARHQDALASLFGQVLDLCERAGMLRLGTLALDSTAIKANAADRQNRSYETLAREIIAEGIATDEREDELYGEARGDEPPLQLGDRKTRRQRFAEAKAELDRERASRPVPAGRPKRLAEAHRRLEEEHALSLRVEHEHEAWRAGREAELAAQGRKMTGRPRKLPRPAPTPAGTINTTDLDSRPVRGGGGGFVQGYRAQAVATTEQIIVAAEIPASPSDSVALEPMVAKALDEVAAAGIEYRPETVLADAGYFNDPQIKSLAARGIEALVPPDRRSRGEPPLKAKRVGAEMRGKLDSPRGRELYRRRQQIIEPVFAQTKSIRRLDRFRRRGLDACQAEWKLIGTTHNLLKLHRAALAPSPC